MTLSEAYTDIIRGLRLFQNIQNIVHRLQVFQFTNCFFVIEFIYSSQEQQRAHEVILIPLHGLVYKGSAELSNRLLRAHLESGWEIASVYTFCYLVLNSLYLFSCPEKKKNGRTTKVRGWTRKQYPFQGTSSLPHSTNWDFPTSCHLWHLPPRFVASSFSWQSSLHHRILCNAVTSMPFPPVPFE